ncbi:MAG: hypothetical protein HZB91_04280 [Elusimicrobia bacterium]|nr:hypothetical protein [Elusimicrobiota bacterium]
MDHLKEFTREQLLTLIDTHAKNWLAHDGCWFLAAEEKLGMERAIELDKLSWERFSPAEARRIMSGFSIPANGGLDALEKALWLRLYACVNKQKVERTSPDRLVLTMLECRVQKARRDKKLPDFHCGGVGIIEYSRFASAIDPRIKTRGLSCFPEAGQEFWCSWEFSI